MKPLIIAVVIGCVISISYIFSLNNTENLGSSPISIISTAKDLHPKPPHPTNQNQSQIPNTNKARLENTNKKSENGSSKPDISTILGIFPNLKSMHERLVSQGRDEKWATLSENTILGLFHQIPDATDMKERITVRCGTTLCEVTGELNDPVYGYDRALDAGMSDTEFTAKMWAGGYRNMGSGRGPGSEGRPTFVVYYQREVPVHIKPQKRMSAGDDPTGSSPQ